jgi:homoprotocatechuate degradation regulator HpaR
MKSAGDPDTGGRNKLKIGKAARNRKDMPNGGSPAGARLPEFSHSLPMALMRGREAVMRYFRPSLREHGVTEQQWRVLRALDQSGAVDLTDLSGITVLLAPSLSRILRDLAKRGLIKRQSVKNDRRRNIVSISAAGRHLISEVAPESEAAYAAIRRQFGELRLSELHKLLEDLETALGVVPGEDATEARRTAAVTRTVVTL